MQAVYLVCDGCDTEIGADGRFRSAAEARAGAYVEGWRFPQALTSRGLLGTRSNDVCPECITGWTPQEFRGTRPTGGKQHRPTQPGAPS